MTKVTDQAKRAYDMLNDEILCPAFNVKITRSGWAHIMKTKERDLNEVKQRVKCFSWIPQILKKSYLYQDYQIAYTKSGKVYFYAVEGVIEYQRIRLIIRQIENQPKHLYSLIYKGVVPKVRK